MQYSNFSVGKCDCGRVFTVRHGVYAMTGGFNRAYGKCPRCRKAEEKKASTGTSGSAGIRWCSECGHKRGQGKACSILRKKPGDQKDFAGFNRCLNREIWCPADVLHVWEETEEGNGENNNVDNEIVCC